MTFGPTCPPPWYCGTSEANVAEPRVTRDAAGAEDVVQTAAAAGEEGQGEDELLEASDGHRLAFKRMFSDASPVGCPPACGRLSPSRSERAS